MNNSHAPGGKGDARPSDYAAGDVESAASVTPAASCEMNATLNAADVRGVPCRFVWRGSRTGFAAAGVLLAVLVGAHMWRSAPRSRGTVADLVAATQNVPIRVVEARLSGGFAWAPYKTGEVPDQSAFTAAAVVLRGSGTHRSGDHAAALAHLLLNRTRAAAALLDARKNDAEDAAIWNDLAAARFHAAVVADDAEELGEALAACDAALRIDASMPEALFNRALILERYGLRDLAREAWERYVAAETSPEWAAEGRQHIARLASILPFDVILTKEYERLATDAAAARHFVRNHPQESRTWGETKILNWWAVAELAGDTRTADKHLRVARTLGNELARAGGDEMLMAAVRAIDGAPPRLRSLLASGHVAFHDGQAAYRENKAATAQPLFTRAASDFERGGSPVALRARYFAASTTYDTGRVLEARGALEELLATAPPRFVAHRAELQWQLGRYYGLNGQWGDGLDVLGQAATTFDALGERNYAATVRQIRSEFYDRIGDPQNAWRERAPSLRELGRRLTPRLLIAISAMSRAAVAESKWERASSLLNLELEICRRVGTPMRRVDMLLLRAQLQARAGDVAAARHSLSEARREIAALNDPALSSLMEDETLVVEALLAPPREAVALLTRAIDSFEPRGRRIFLPRAFLHRGRAYLQAGDRARAASDFEAGIAELESGRESLPAGAIRWGVLHAVENLFDEAISLALATGDAQRALSCAERARARELRDVLDAPAISGRAPDELPPGTAIVEYVALEKQLVTFLIDRQRVHMVSQPISRSDLARAGSILSRAVAEDDSETRRHAGRRMHQLLIEPVKGLLSRDTKLVVVPDSTLRSVPFAALVDDRGRYLVEEHELVISPSAAVFLKLSKRRDAAGAGSRLLIVTNPARSRGSEGSLPYADAEGRAIAAFYKDVVSLTGDDATVTEFMRHAPQARVIHFAGHAIAAGGKATALLFAESGTDAGVADADALSALKLDSIATVVLAGCDTANGEVRGTEGTISVARAFLAAGAPSVIATLHRIDDEDASQFFRLLHAHLVRGETPAAAVRAAQTEWIRRGGGGKVSTWAAVQSIGR